MKSHGGITQKVMKAMGIFGGVQVVGIVCSMVRNKLVSLWLGEVGVGLFALFNNTLETLNNATTLGMRNSSVRDISNATTAGRNRHVATVVTVVRRWAMWLGLAGALLTICLAPALSQYFFKDTSYQWHFVALSSAVLLMSLTGGEQAVLQGLAKLRPLARATMAGTIGGLIVSIPLFYYLGQRSVMPSIIAYAACITAATFLMRDRSTPKVNVSAHETVQMGKGFIALGIFMTIGNFLTILMNLIFSAWLNRHGGTAQVGLYQAGYTLIIKYAGLVFAALGVEYYPRLAAHASKKTHLRVYVSQEINVSMHVLAPVLCLMVMMQQFVIRLLYSGDFLVIGPMVMWGMAGTVFRAVSWCIAFVIIAKGDGRTYVITETLSVAAGLTLNILFYTHWGLTGLGWSFVAWYVIYTLIVGIVYYRRYHLSLSAGSIMSVLWVTCVALAVVSCAMLGYNAAGWAVTAVALAVSSKCLLHSWRR